MPVPRHGIETPASSPFIRSRNSKPIVSILFAVIGLTLLASGPRAAAQSTPSANGDFWTWMGGSPTIVAAGVGRPGVYGEKGVPNAKNIPGGRIGFASWQDHSGHFWIFGGSGFDAKGKELCMLNDLWEYNPATKEWTWWGGNSLQQSKPDPIQGTAGVYGTLGKPSPKNWPGSRSYSVTWQDAHGNIWLFGGFAFDSGARLAPMNDLWELNPSTREWTWMSGSGTLLPGLVGEAGVYGTKGQASPKNVPGSRADSIGWIDKQGNLWLFGGFLEQLDTGSPALCADSDQNDLWKFNPNTKEWTWMAGNPPGEYLYGCDQSIAATPSLGVYGTKGVAAPANTPGDREQATGWVDAEGHFWLFGGLGYPDNRSYGYLNDIWEFNPSTSEWTWQGGRKDLPDNGAAYEGDLGGGLGATGVYGKLGKPAPANAPGARFGAAGAVDGNGNLWLYGGVGSDSKSDVYSLDDLWKFSPSSREWTWMAGESSVVEPLSNEYAFGCKNSQDCGVPGSYGLPGIPASSNTPGARHAHALWIDDSDDVWTFGGFGIGQDSAPGWLNDLWEYRPPESGAVTTATLSSAALSFAGVVGAKSAAQTVTLTNTGSASLSIGQITFAGLNPADFTETNNCGKSVKPKAKCTISISLAPVQAGYLVATLFVLDDATGWPQPITLAAKVALATPKVTLKASTSSATKGAEVVLTATVTGVSGVEPTGSVYFSSGNFFEVAAVDKGKAILTTTKLPVGKDSIVANYSGDSSYNTENSAPVTVTIKQ
jgi:N-acetylneuraminic acid mutarotase